MKLFRLLRNAGAILRLVKRIGAAAQEKELSEQELREIVDEMVPLAKRLGLVK